MREISGRGRAFTFSNNLLLFPSLPPFRAIPFFFSPHPPSPPPLAHPISLFPRQSRGVPASRAVFGDERRSEGADAGQGGDGKGARAQAERSFAQPEEHRHPGDKAEVRGTNGSVVYGRLLLTASTPLTPSPLDTRIPNARNPRTPATPDAFTPGRTG